MLSVGRARGASETLWQSQCAPTFCFLVAVVERPGEVLVDNAGRVAGVVGEYNAGGRQILSASLAVAADAGDAAATANAATAAAASAAAAGVQWQLLGHGARG